MNRIQFGLFFLYVLSMWSVGATVGQWINPQRKFFNRAWYLGESLLLGSIVIVSQMLLLSLLGLYKAPFLWAVVIGNLSCLFFHYGRRSWSLLKGPWPFNGAAIIFILLVAVFMFRNCYFLVDVDSHSTYLYAQKLWLEHGSSIFSSPALDMKTYVPHFNAVPYALSLSIFPKETLFPQLVVAFWTVILLLLVYGYASYRLSPLYGLAAVMLTIFNDHIYFSGANAFCIINSALIAVLFASAVNFWEAYRRQDTTYFVLAVIFWVQIIANKYQLFYGFMFLGLFGFLVQQHPWKIIKEIFFKQSFILPVSFSFLSVSMWFIKNGLSTGVATFPILAGEFHALNWTKEMANVFNQYLAGPLPFTMVVKYFSYMCFWPGVNAAKILMWFILFLPAAILLSLRRNQCNMDILKETCYWMMLAVVVMIGICMVSFVDPRHYRYSIALIAMAVVFGVYFLLHCSVKAPRFLEVILVLLVSVQGWAIMLHQGGEFKKPTFSDNWLVLTDQLHMREMEYYYYPNNMVIDREFPYYADRLKNSAWDIGIVGNAPFSAFLAPTRPQVGPWYTTAVQWDSYKDPMLIAKDLSTLNIDVIMTVRNNHMQFEDVFQYAQKAVNFDRHPTQKFYNYGFPEELSEVRY